jgi:hypothetical protein
MGNWRVALGAMVALALPWATLRGAVPNLPAGGAAARPVPPLPPLPAGDASLPPLPERSLRNANYTIEARLDPERHVLDGSLVLEWQNTSGVPLATFPFHLYWNAFRDNLSTSARGESRRVVAAPYSDEERDRRFGYIQVKSVQLLGAGTDTADAAADVTRTLRYIQPDDANADDRTVMEVSAPAPVAPGGTARFRITWTSHIPYGDVGRAGWVHDYHFIAQWFPKIGVYWKGAWNAHQFHPTTEFFSDYGAYDVRLTVPEGYVVGATGALQETLPGPAAGTRTFRFRQDDVHDFTWTTSRRFVEKADRFDDPGYPPVAIRLLVQPEHEHLAARYIEATKIALRSYGAWSAPYPYAQITVVDPAWGSASGGMEYPTLFTGGATVRAPRVLQSPESVTIHECGHQFWYGLVGNNEFEEAWLDEGFNSYHDEKAGQLALGPVGWSRRYFGPTTLARGLRAPWPVVAPQVRIGRGEGDLAALRRSGKSDVMARRGWDYASAGAYTLNSYGKPSLSLQTLEALVGDDTMTRILRTYARRFRFAHPSSEDFIATVNEVTGQDWRWYFDQTWFSADLCDYAVDVHNDPARVRQGFEEKGGDLVMVPKKPKDGDEEESFDAEVTVKRLGEVRMPVEVVVEFADGGSTREAWDGQYRWARFRYPGKKVVRAVVDPERKIMLDVNPANNSWVDENGLARQAAVKWAARWMFWLQHLLELHAVVG